MSVPVSSPLIVDCFFIPALPAAHGAARADGRAAQAEQGECRGGPEARVKRRVSI
jgi:hypothetical protein